jgi:hypothetical protein
MRVGLRGKDIQSLWLKIGGYGKRAGSGHDVTNATAMRPLTLEFRDLMAREPARTAEHVRRPGQLSDTAR